MLSQIKSIYINDKKPSGEPYIDRTGNPFKRAVLETADGKKASMIISQNYGKKDLAIIQEWKAGDFVDVVLEQSGDFLNFKLPTKTDIVVEKTNSLEERVKTLETSFTLLKSLVTGRQTQEELKEEVPAYREVTLDQIPF